MATVTATSAGDSGIISQAYQKVHAKGAGNSVQVMQDVHDLLHVSGSRGLVFDAAGGALTNGSTGTKNVVDLEGTIIPTKANEIRYLFGQRIYNIVTNSFDATVLNSGVQANTTATATTITFTAGTGGLRSKRSAINPALNSAMESAIAISKNNKDTIVLFNNNSSGGPDATTEHLVITLPTNETFYKRRTVTGGSINSLGFDFGLYNSPSVGGDNLPGTVNITKWQVENKTGMVGNYPLEYVRVGAGDIYNSGLDAIKYKNTIKTFTYMGIAVGDSFGDANTEWPSIIAEASTGAVANYCIAGALLTGVIGSKHAANIGNKNFDVVFIQGGINDVVADVTLASMQTAVQTMVNASVGKTIVIINIAPFYGYAGYTTARQNVLLSYNAWLVTYCAANGIYLADIYTILGDPGQTNRLLPSYDSGDHVHPNAVGEGLIKDAVIAVMPVFNTPYQTAPMSILHEKATTNLATSPRDLTNAAYVKTNCTAAKTATGTDGYLNSASTLTATAANATCLQTVTSASAERITGAFIKRRTGTGVINMTQDNGTTWTPVTVPAAWGTEALVIPAATLADPVFGFQIVTSGDSIDVDWVQHELGSHITSPISGSRTIDAIKIPLSANINFPQTKGIAFIKVTPQFANSATAKSLLCTNSAATDFIHDNGSGEIAINDGTNTATTSGLGGWAVGDTLLIAAVWITDTMSIHVSKNGGAWVDSANATYDGAFPVGANFLLCNANTDSILINAIKIKSTTKILTDAQEWAKNSAVYEAV